MAPAPAQRGPVLGLCFDGQARADQARSHETGMELFGQRPAHEHGGVQLVRRGSRSAATIQSGGGKRPCNERPSRPRARRWATRASVPNRPSTEAAGGRQSPQRLYAQAHQQVRQSGHVSGAGSSPRVLSSAPASTLTGRGARNRALASRGTTSGWPGGASWPPAPPRKARRRRPPGSNRSSPPPPRSQRTSRRPRLRCRRRLWPPRARPPEIAGGPPCAESEPARPEHLYTRSERFHCSQGRLPAADLGRHVPGHHLEVRATALHLPPAHTRPGTGGPGGR